MWRFLVIGCTLLTLGLGLVWLNPPAWGLGAIVFDGPQHGGGGGYLGPNNAVSGALEVWSLRCADTAHATGSTKVVQLQRASDSTTQDIVCLSSGDFDAASATTFCLATTCGVSIWYGQVNGHDLPQGLNQLVLTLNCINISLPCVHAGGNDTVSATITGLSAQPYTGVILAQRTGNTSVFNGVLGTNSGGFGILGFANATDTDFIYAGNVAPTQAANDNVFHSIIGVFDSPNCTIQTDGVLSSPADCGSSAPDNVVTIGTASSGSFGLLGDVTEVIIYASSSMSSGNQTAMCHNQRLYWGTGGSC